MRTRNARPYESYIYTNGCTECPPTSEIAPTKAFSCERRWLRATQIIASNQASASRRMSSYKHLKLLIMVRIELIEIYSLFCAPRKPQVVFDKIIFNSLEAVPLVSLRLGHARGKTTHCVVF